MNKPLAGKRVLITRAQEQARPMIKAIEKNGGEPVVIPVLAFRPAPLSIHEQERLIDALKKTDWIVFTSANSIKYFFYFAGHAKHLLEHIKIAVVGKKTEEVLKDYGFSPELVPETYTAEALAQNLIKHENPHQSVLLPLGQLAKPILKETLKEAGFNIKDVVVYHTVKNEASRPALINSMIQNQLDVITFTSPSSIHFFIELLSPHDWKTFINHKVVACIGKVTADAALSKGIRVQAVPKDFTAQSLVAAIAEYYLGELK
ncbi:uroporphyrinogen-III synthase [Scopulibacillus daqui]|uniref:Uroporphyrinogen-III synthase n=1 Tax=Scopulibacillus daqui TaxID=1469162 RepID=A0ABS2PXH3_9BACL|nr:uroporphyrinogen-III synthase [Scopulibacillus daqui]MBM7644733.1 uroporphyrinogen-III synthase [Scopulibacillus daqui]